METCVDPKRQEQTMRHAADSAARLSIRLHFLSPLLSLLSFASSTQPTVLLSRSSSLVEMWQSQPQPVRFNQYGNNYYDVLATTTLNPNPNASIDFVVTQVEKLANQINTLTVDGETAGLQIADRGIETFNRMKDAFNNETIQNVERIGDIASAKFGDWPVTELIVMVIVGVVLVLITLIFLFLLFGERVTEYRFRKKLSAESDIENI